PELMILDLGLPDMDGLEIIRQVRQWSQLPIIVVSARDREKEKVAALDLGADDYIVKPFGISELLARIRTALRRMEHLSNSPLVVEEILRVRDLVIDPGKRTVTVAGLAIHLTQIEFKIISLLAKYPKTSKT
ncbi:MAG: response regulator, partial [Clostridiales bacterium]